jgi:hypothetical protein
MNKEKLNSIPFNLFWCLSTLSISYVVLSLMSVNYPFYLAFVIYLIDVKYSSNNDYLEDKIKNLENKLNKDGNN